jgi:pimeloyl-ACP methyl ester carboxylesterase
MRCALVFALVGCASHHASEPEPDAAPATTVPLNLLFVHGVDSGNARANAQDSLADLDAYVVAGLAAKLPGVTLRSHRVNLYTDLDGNVISPSIDAPSDGTGVPVATNWRRQLVAKLDQAYPDGERNIILIGHSTGARVSMEVAANIGADGQPGSYDWGVADRIAGVITMNGMLHDLQSNDFNFIGPLDFITGCKVNQETGWCEYAGRISGVPAADAVTTSKRSLVLISAGDSSGACSPTVWTGENDKVLPLLAQGCPSAPGAHVTPSKDGDVVAPGTFYGSFCHSDTTNRGSPRHIGAIAAAGDQMIAWLAGVAADL